MMLETNTNKQKKVSKEIKAGVKTRNKISGLHSLNVLFIYFQRRFYLLI